MKRRILVEMDVEGDVGWIMRDIAELVMNRIDMNVEFSIKQEILPEKSSGEIQIPKFLNRNRFMSKWEGGMRNG